MSKNVIVISVELRETRVALIEDGIIAELHLERKGNTKVGGAAGDVYLGKVTRVLPGLQAAFIDIGLERAAFLHVEDLIRPDDFETYLAGGRKHARGEGDGRAAESDEEGDDDEAVAGLLPEAPSPAGEGPGGGEPADLSPPSEVAPLSEEAGASGVDAAPADDVPAEVSPDLQDDDAPLVSPSVARQAAASALPSLPSLSDASEDVAMEEGDDDEGDDEALSSGAPSTFDLTMSDPDVSPDDVDEDDDDDVDDLDEGDDDTSPDTEAAAAGEPPPEDAPTGQPAVAAAALAGVLDDLDMPDLPGFTITDPGEPTPRAPAPRTETADRRRGRGRRGRSRGRSGEVRSGEARPEGRSEGRGEGRSGGRGGRGEGRSREARAGSGDRTSLVPGRISKSTPIREVVREGQEIIVQITKEPIGTKGARCSSHISLPGRYVVYLPTVEHVGVSKRIGSDRERSRLRETIASIKPPTGGLIVRTLAEGLTKKHLKQDVGYLVRLWGEIAKKREGTKAPVCLSSELDIILKTARDLFTDEVDQIVIDDKREYERLVRFVDMFMPERLKDVVYYNGDEPIFDAYGIEDEIGRALARKVPLPSGGHLIIDQAEALTAIDVNTGRFVGKGSKDMEETILKTNLEAVQEIAYQLRFRNIGGLVILDLIDMEKTQNREKVRKKLEELLLKDKAKTTVNRISDLGLIEMTRKRTRESLGRLMHEPCFYCDGTGQLQSKETVAYEILREIRRKRNDLPGYTVVVNAHPSIADLLTGQEKAAVTEAENRYMRKITVVPRKEYHYEQFDLVGK